LPTTIRFSLARFPTKFRKISKNIKSSTLDNTSR
jgi:hypothetical protein